MRQGKVARNKFVYQITRFGGRRKKMIRYRIMVKSIDEQCLNDRSRLAYRTPLRVLQFLIII